ncbi:unnamed protein product [Darwinula stevensoni]|uniref:Nudix hydrolase domain-containing protein n=1 Tax=Darwinula stevensoni TaxID=69355 RepID=A0A7R8X938_9CRUS|nr:unnamed protein product [Darwinula stevensoni]CAG0889292.1 unnamed protein product [Darwinula stevensoni]
MAMWKHWRNAASLILGWKRRPDVDKLKAVEKILLVQRGASSDFMAKAHVFPGGVISSADFDPEWKKLFHSSDSAIEALIKSDERQYAFPMYEEYKSQGIQRPGLALRICALRETFEETGIFLGRAIDSQSPVILSGSDVGDWPDKVAQQADKFLEFCLSYKYLPDVLNLQQWTNWLTPRDRKTRHDAMFFSMTISSEEPPTVIVDSHELTSFKWLTALEALELHDKLECMLTGSQYYELFEISRYGMPGNDASKQDLVKKRKMRWMPVKFNATNGSIAVLPGDSMYPEVPDLTGDKPIPSVENSIEELRSQSSKLHRFESTAMLKHWKNAACLILGWKRRPDVDKLKAVEKILLVQRSAGIKDMPQGQVFPGGIVSSADFNPEWKKLFHSSDSAIETLIKSEERQYGFPMYEEYKSQGIQRPGLALRICALRETFEETGIFLGRAIDSQSPVILSGSDVGDWPDKVAQQADKFLEFCLSYKYLPNHWKNAASLILGWKRKPDIEKLKTVEKILLVQRSAGSEFMANAHVFPGGVISSADFDPEWKKLFHSSDSAIEALIKSDERQYAFPLYEEFKSQGIQRPGLALRICALRETFEETGIFLGRAIDSQSPVILSGSDVGDWPKKVAQQADKFLEFCLSYKYLPDVLNLQQWTNWLTPSDMKKRYDTMFFSMTISSEEPPTVIKDSHEITSFKWLTPLEALELYYKSEFWLAPPQYYELLEMTRCGMPGNDASKQDLVKKRKMRWLPVRINTTSGVIVVLPGDSLYPEVPDLTGDKPVASVENSIEELRSQSSQLHRLEMTMVILEDMERLNNLASMDGSSPDDICKCLEKLKGKKPSKDILLRTGTGVKKKDKAWYDSYHCHNVGPSSHDQLWNQHQMDEHKYEPDVVGFGYEGLMGCRGALTQHPHPPTPTSGYTDPIVHPTIAIHFKTANLDKAHSSGGIGSGST